MRARRRSVLVGSLTALIAAHSLAQPSAADWIAGEIVKIDSERGTVTIRHSAIAHLHLPAATTIFRYVDPVVVLRIKPGDRIRFRSDRYDGTLRLVNVVPVAAAP